MLIVLYVHVTLLMFVLYVDNAQFGSVCNACNIYIFVMVVIYVMLVWPGNTCNVGNVIYNVTNAVNVGNAYNVSNFCLIILVYCSV